MTDTNPATRNEAPKPSAAEIKHALATVIAKPSRPRHIALLIASLCGAGVSAALLATEPTMPARTRVALVMMTAIGLSWSTYSIWILFRQGALLGRHRVVAARMAFAFSSLFLASVVALGAMGELQNAARWPWYAVMLTGLVMVAVSIVLLRRSQSRYRELTQRRESLERKLKSISAVLVLFVLASFGEGRNLNAQSTASPSSAVSLKEGSFTVGGQAMKVVEGRFQVSANRSSNSQAKLTLAFVQFKSTSAAPRAPIVFLAGGPGDAATRALAGMPRSLLDALLSVGDVIAFDQRGTGLSEPLNPFCAPGEFLPRDRAADPDVFLQLLKSRVESCLAKAAADGIDAKGLTTQESADDINELRAALGVQKVSLLSASYGTHLALATAHRHPTAIARMVLAGVEGLDDTFKLPSRVDAVLETIAKAKRPALLQDLRALRSRLKAEPAKFTFPTGQTIVLGEWDLMRWTSESLDAVQKIDAMVAAVPQMLDGNFAMLGQWALGYRVPKPLGVMNLAMDCASYASADRLRRIANESRTSVLGAAINFPLPVICDVAGLPRLPDSYRTAKSVNVAALLISGTFDGRTPPQNAVDAARALPNADLLVIDGASHGLFREAKVNEAMIRFFSAK